MNWRFLSDKQLLVDGDSRIVNNPSIIARVASLSPGSKLGPYEIVAALGAGGMGEVYRARDPRLGREVAIKILPTGSGGDPDRLRRFEQEARATAALNHPNILAVFDIGKQDDSPYIVSELLEGETLRARLSGGPLPVRKAVDYAVQLTRGLAAAHRHAILHRDLKPENIFITRDGHAKILDFGLAKLTMPEPGSGEMSAPATLDSVTGGGVFLGTLGYMSPEQCRGAAVDARSDLFSFGAVLYEMVSGRRAFHGETTADTVSAILREDPPELTAAGRDVPPMLERIVHHCLEKEPTARFQSASDVEFALESLSTISSASLPAAASPKRAKFAWIVAAVAALVVIGLAAFLLNRTAPWMQVTRTMINPPEKTTLNLAGDSAGPPVLSPDGKMLAFTATRQDGSTAIWVRPLDSLEAQPMQGSEGAVFPFWSPDSRALGFFADGKLKTIDLNGSSPQIVADAPSGRGGAWGADGVILFSSATVSPLLRVNATGGTPVQITKIDPSQHTSHRWPFFLPDGKHFLYLAINHTPSEWTNDMLYFASVDGKENRALFHSLSNAIYAGGFLLFARNDQLMAQPFDPSKGKLSGEALTIAKGLLSDLTTWHMDASAFSDKLLVMGSGSAPNWQLLWMDRDGKQITNIADNLPTLQRAALSPQGDRIAVEMDDGRTDIWVLSLAHGVRTRLTFGPIANHWPAWSPDGKWIAYVSESGAHSILTRKPADGSGPEEQLYTEDQPAFITQWTRDGKYLIYNRGPVGSEDSWALPLQGERKPFLLVKHGKEGRVSPDGHWLAYVSSDPGASEVYVSAFRGQGKWQASTHGGGWAVWSGDGKQLYYMDLRLNVYTVPVTDAGGALQFGPPQTLISNWSSPLFFFDVSPNGKKILLDRIAQQVGQSMTVVMNYGVELRKK